MLARTCVPCAAHRLSCRLDLFCTWSPSSRFPSQVRTGCPPGNSCPKHLTRQARFVLTAPIASFSALRQTVALRVVQGTPLDLECHACQLQRCHCRLLQGQNRRLVVRPDENLCQTTANHIVLLFSNRTLVCSSRWHNGHANRAITIAPADQKNEAPAVSCRLVRSSYRCQWQSPESRFLILLHDADALGHVQCKLTTPSPEHSMSAGCVLFPVIRCRGLMAHTSFVTLMHTPRRHQALLDHCCLSFLLLAQATRLLSESSDMTSRNSSPSAYGNSAVRLEIHPQIPRTPFPHERDASA